MNQTTRDIMALLGVTAQEAMKIQDEMQIDFSECTTREFNKRARETAAELGIKTGTPKRKLSAKERAAAFPLLVALLRNCVAEIPDGDALRNSTRADARKALRDLGEEV